MNLLIKSSNHLTNQGLILIVSCKEEMSFGRK